MPLPLLAWAAIALGGAGVVKTIDAAVDNDNAKEINRDANRIVDEAKARINSCKDASGESLKALGAKKVFVLDNGIKQFLDLFTQLKNVDFRNTPGLDEFVRIDAQDLSGLREMSSLAGSFAGGTAAGTVAGALTAFGAYSGVMALGTASTGAAISGLAGAAATNATLERLGGGSLAAGGMGMAGGMAVLGGLVAAPALAVLGLFMGSSVY